MFEEKFFLYCGKNLKQPVQVNLELLVPLAEALQQIQDWTGRNPAGIQAAGRRRLWHPVSRHVVRRAVAVKILRTEGIPSEEVLEVFRKFRKEVSIMSALLHLNLVGLKGYYFGEGRKALIMELMNRGDLYSLINGPNSYPLSVTLKIAFDIANGMNYLHSMSPVILHQDLKPPNILLCSDEKWGYLAKVADFGLSAKQYLASLKERAVETPVWLAPEILSGKEYSTKSDVYAFGIILYELLEHKAPFKNFDFRFLTELKQLIISGKRSSLDRIRTTSPELAQLINDCWANDPFAWPSFSQILQSLIKITQVYDSSLSSFLRTQRAFITSTSNPGLEFEPGYETCLEPHHPSYWHQFFHQAKITVNFTIPKKVLTLEKNN